MGWKSVLFSGLLAGQVFCMPAAAAAEANFDARNSSSLGDLLLEIGAQARISILFPEELYAVESSETFSLSGGIPLQEVLELLLEDTSYKCEQLSQRVFSVRKIPITEKARDETEKIQSSTNDRSSNTPSARDDIVVIGLLSEKKLQDAPTSISSYTNEVALERNYIDLFDSLEHLPNVTEAFGGTQVTIRGITLKGPANIDSGSLSNIFIDGVPLYTEGLFTEGLPLWDISQVEVHRGPQSINFGRNAMAGAIVMSSNAPEFDWNANARFYTGSYGLHGYQGAVGGPLIDGGVAVRLSASRQRYNGAAVNKTLNRDDWNKQNSDFVRGQVLIEPDSAVGASLLLSGSYFYDANGQNSVTLESGKRRVSFANVDGESQRKNYIFSARLRLPVCGNCKLTSFSALKKTDASRDYDGDNDLTIVDGESFQDTAHTELDDSGYYQDLRISYSDPSFRAMAGLHFDRVDTFYELQRYSLSSALNLKANKNAQNFALVFETSFDVFSRLNLSFGGRLDWDQASYELNGIEAKVSSFFFLPSLELIYELSNNQSFGFLVNKGARSGGAYIDGEQLSTYGSEYMWNSELFYRTSIMNEKIRLRSNVFYADWYDQQSFFRDEEGRFGIENRGGSKLYGIEVETNAVMTENLSFFLNYGHLQTSLNSEASFVYNVPPDVGAPQFRYAPRHTLAAGIAYAHNSGLDFNLEASYQSGAFTEEANVAGTRINNRFVVNARVSYEFDTMRIGVFGENLFDEYYLLSNISFNGRYANVGKPRIFGVLLEATF